MTTVEKRSVSLSPELAAAVDQAVAGGEYGNASEVIREALRQWKERREFHGDTVAELRQLWREGMESGVPQPVTDETFAEIRAAAASRMDTRKR